MALNDFLSLLLRVTVRIVLLAIGLVFALSLLCAAAVLAVVWWVRLMWAKLTGRPVQAWVFKVDPRAGWNRFYRAGDPFARGTRGPGQANGEAAHTSTGGDDGGRLSASGDWRDKRAKDVTDVDPK